MFKGRLGRERTFMLHQADAALKIPSDLAGVTAATYRWPRNDGNHRSAVGAACDSIRKAIRDLGVSDTKVRAQVHDIQVRRVSTESQIRTLQVVVKVS